VDCDYAHKYMPYTGGIDGNVAINAHNERQMRLIHQSHKPSLHCPSFNVGCASTHKAPLMITCLLLLLRGIQLDHIINAQNSNGSLGGKTQALNLGDRWLYHTSGHVVTDLATDQVHATVLQVRLLL